MSATSLVVYIVDDDRNFRESLEELVGLMGYRAIGFDTAEAFLEDPRIQRPACLLLDMYLPALDGFWLQDTLKAKGISLPVIYITGHGDVPMSVKALKKGASDFLLKPFPPEDLRAAIITALTQDAANVAHEARQHKIMACVKSLTPREYEVMCQVITGKLNKQIAATLGTAEKTIRKHRGQVMRKMRVASVADLVRALETVGIAS
ncbi:MAG: response regulator transcription factor [Candidatus Omnitrophica bacterium]|nr:response regulator transcription factor [Candidatus Omnitrophota bacterium]